MSALNGNGNFGKSPHNHVSYELIDKDGHIQGPYDSLTEASEIAQRLWPDQTQDQDRTGRGRDVQVVGSR